MKLPLNAQNLMNRFFRQVDNVVWDLMSGRVGIKNADGIVTIEGEGDEAQVVVNPFDQFGFEVPAFAQNTPIESVALGDLIYGAHDVTGWVVEKKEKSFVLLKANGTRTTWSPPKVQMLGFDSGVMVLRSLVNMLPSGADGLNNIQSNLLPLMMMSGDGEMEDLSSMMPLLLMSQLGNTAVNTDGEATPNPLAGANMGNMFQTMMMMKMLNGKSGMPGRNNFFD